MSYVQGKKKLGTAQNTYQCRDNQTGQTYAIKIYQTQNDEQIQQLKENLDIIKQIKSKQFVKIKTYYIEKQFVKVIMEYVEGTSLAQLSNILPDEVYADYSKQLFRILIYLQDNNIKYGYIDLNNIYQSKNGELKLQLCKFVKPANYQNHSIETGKALFKLIAQQDFVSIQQVQQSLIEQKFKILIEDLVQNKNRQNIILRSPWIVSSNNDNSPKTIDNVIQMDGLQLDKQLAKNLVSKQKKNSLLQVRDPTSFNDKTNEDSYSSWSSDKVINKQVVKPKGSTALLNKIKQGLFKQQNKDNSMSIGKQYSQKNISNKYQIEDMKLQLNTNQKLIVKKKQVQDEQEVEFSDSDENQQPENEIIEKVQENDNICMKAYDFNTKPSIELGVYLLKEFLNLKDGFYQFYRQYLQPTLLLDIYNCLSQNVEQWIYYIQVLVTIFKSNIQIKSDILILGIQPLIYNNMMEYFKQDQKLSQKIFFSLGEYCQTIIQENQEDELKVLQLFLVNKGIQIISTLLKINKIFLSDKQMMNAFTDNDKFLQMIGCLLQLMNYCSQKGYKYQVYRLSTEDDNNAITTYTRFCLSLYDGQNTFNNKNEVLNLLKQYLEFIIKSAGSCQPYVIQTKQNIQLLTNFIQKSDHNTKTLLLQLLIQICNQPSDKFLNENQEKLTNTIREQIVIYLTQKLIEMQDYMLSNTENIYKLIQLFIRNSLQRAEQLFDKQTVENLDYGYQEIIFSNYKNKDQFISAINLLQITAENILLTYLKMAGDNFQQLNVQVRTHLVKLALQQFVKQQKLQQLSIFAMYKFCHIYEFDRLLIDDLQQIDINQQYFLSQVKILDQTKWDSIELSTFQLQQINFICNNCKQISQHIFNINFIQTLLIQMKQNEQEVGFLEFSLRLFKIYFEQQQQQNNDDNYTIINLQNKIVTAAEALLQHKNQTIKKLAGNIISLRR